MIHLTLRGLHRDTSPRTVGPFIWSEAHQVHLWQGRPLTAEDFNAFAASREWDRQIELHGGLLKIKVVEEVGP